MKFKITEGVNQFTGSAMFYLYESEGKEPERWRYLFGASTIEECRAALERKRNPVAEKVIEEFEWLR